MEGKEQTCLGAGLRRSSRPAPFGVVPSALQSGGELERGNRDAQHSLEDPGNGRYFSKQNITETAQRAGVNFVARYTCYGLCF